jgi:hypothetical protein
LAFFTSTSALRVVESDSLDSEVIPIGVQVVQAKVAAVSVLTGISAARTRDVIDKERYVMLSSSVEIAESMLLQWGPLVARK